MVFLFCSATMSVAMLIGAIFKDMLQAAILAITFYYADLNGSLGSYMGGFSMYTPQNIFSAITTGTDNANLLDTSQSLSNWLNGHTLHDNDHTRNIRNPNH